MSDDRPERHWTSSMSEGSTMHDRLPRSEGLYEWRMPHAKDPTMKVVFLARMRRRGAGYQTVVSPEFDYWDGYRLHLPRQIEWREAEEGADLPNGRSYHCLEVEGIEPEPCPFCHKIPRPEGHAELIPSGRAFDWKPFACTHWQLKCCGWVNSPTDASLANLVERRRRALHPEEC